MIVSMEDEPKPEETPSEEPEPEAEEKATLPVNYGREPVWPPFWP
jgi:hypothetical protein